MDILTPVFYRLGAFVSGALIVSFVYIIIRVASRGIFKSYFEEKRRSKDGK